MSTDGPHYTPPQTGRWERVPPEKVGMRGDALREAIDYAVGSEIRWPHDLHRLLVAAEKPPHNHVLGPTRDRGPASGLVIRHGRIVAEWGAPGRSDMTFSATKSYLATVAGLAHDAGRIRDLHEPVGATVEDGFESPHNAGITWHHLLQQTSEWEGTLFGIPDAVDHNRSAGPDGPPKGTPRKLREPGSWWEYNDVRVNRLGLALLRVWREPLPDVLKRELMDPIGASDDWQWHGYRNSWADVGGRRMQSVPGGAHWGGGLWISSFDHARFGLLHLRRGEWNGKRLLSEDWINRATTPCEKNPTYGYLFWLNTNRALYPAASPASFAAQGAGGNVVVIEPEHDLVLVCRWAADPPGILERVLAAVVNRPDR